MISEIEDYFAKGCGRCPRFATAACSVQLWHEGLAALRQLCRDEGLAETVRWGHPCYRHADRNIALIGAFRDDFRLTFFDAALLADPQGVLEAQGPRSAPDALRFTEAAQVAARAPLIRTFLRQAIACAEAGLRPAPRTHTFELPTELAEALAADAALAAAFARLTPGRQRSHVLALETAKTAATRLARIEKLRPRILAGKGATER